MAELTLQEVMKVVRTVAKRRARHFQREDAEADDLEQIGLLRVLPTLPQESRAYVGRVAANAIVDHWRKIYGVTGKKRPGNKQYAVIYEGREMPAPYELAEEDPTPAYQHRESLGWAMEHLTMDEKRLVCLKAHGHSNHEIAETLGLGYQAVTYRLRVMRRRLKEIEDEAARWASDYWRDRQALRNRAANHCKVDRRREAPGMEGSR